MISFKRESPEFETPPQSREEVLAALKQEDGIRGEAKYRFTLWLEQKQNEIDASESKHGRLIYNIEAAELLLEAELYAEAKEYSDAATTVVENEIGFINTIDGMVSGEVQGLLDRLRDIHIALQQKNP